MISKIRRIIQTRARMKEPKAREPWLYFRPQMKPWHRLKLPRVSWEEVKYHVQVATMIAYWKRAWTNSMIQKKPKI